MEVGALPRTNVGDNEVPFGEGADEAEALPKANMDKDETFGRGKDDVGGGAPVPLGTVFGGDKDGGAPVFPGTGLCGDEAVRGW